MWDVKLKLIDTTLWWLPGGSGWGVAEGEGAKYLVAEDDLTVGGGHTVYRSCVREIHTGNLCTLTNKPHPDKFN